MVYLDNWQNHRRNEFADEFDLFIIVGLSSGMRKVKHGLVARVPD